MSGVIRPGRRRRWKWRSRWTRILLATQAFTAILLLARTEGWLQPAELFVYDRLVAAWAGHGVSDRITLVTITEDDIDKTGWPLRDADLAALLERLSGWGARVIGVDLYRDRPLPPGEDRLARLRSTHPEIIWAFKLRDSTNQGVQASPGATRTALADVVTDAGDVVRRGLMAAADTASSGTAPTLGAAVAQVYAGKTLRDIDDHSVGLGAGRIELVGPQFGPYAWVDAAGYQTMLDFAGGPDRFAKFSMGQVMLNDALANRVAGRIVLVGTGALSVKDSFVTPLSNTSDGQSMLGVMLHAQLADQLLRIKNGEAISRVPLSEAAESALIWTCGLFSAFVVLSLSSVTAVILTTAMGTGLIAGAVYTAFGFGIILPGVGFGLALLGVAITGIVALHGIGIRERLRLRRSFEHYLDPRIIQEMMDQETLPSFGGEYREISVMFTDLTAFTMMSETMPAPEIAALLHDYFDAACAAVLECGGLVGEFMGDGLLALFGAPQAQDDHADRAVDAALRIDEFAHRFTAEQRAKGIPWGETRIGVHSGTAMVGNVGTRSRLRYGAVGDVLNTASRLVGVNKRTGTRISVSGQTMRLCQRQRFRPVGEFALIGRHEAIVVATPCLPADQALDNYLKAYDALKDGSPDAGVRFQALRQDDAAEPCVAFHLARLSAGETGVQIRMEEK